MEYNVKLKYVGVNAYGVHVYTDPLSRYLIRTAKSLTHIQANPWVKYLGDFYMGEDDACYVVTTDPENMDKLGNQMPLAQPPVQEPASKQEKPGMSRTRFLVPPSFEKKMNDKNVLGTVLVHKVHLEDPTLILYKDSNHQCYTMLRRVGVEHPTEVTLYIYKSPLNLGSQYYDNAENEYTKVDLPQFRRLPQTMACQCLGFQDMQIPWVGKMAHS